MSDPAARPFPVLDLVVLDCPDALGLARFHGAVLGWEQHPQIFHLDFAVPSIAEAEPAVLSAGARVHEHQPSESGSFRVYLDPAGHPFCLCQ